VDGAGTAAGTVDTATVAAYTITYSATDAASNVATEVTRTVNVIDVTPPVITINGENPLDHLLNTTYSDAGASANDAVDGTIMVNTNGTVDTTVPGVNTITYTAMDTSGNEATAIRTVNVVTVLLQPLNDTGISFDGNYPSGNNTTCIGEIIAQ